MMGLLILVRFIILIFGLTSVIAKRCEMALQREQRARLAAASGQIPHGYTSNPNQNYEGLGYYPEGALRNRRSIEGSQETSNHKINNGKYGRMRRQIPTNSSCKMPPPRIPNSKTEIINPNKILETCLDNYLTQLNTSLVAIECQDGQWRLIDVPARLTRGELRCSPHCNPPCKRGECVAKETSTHCRCPGLYSGAACEIAGCPNKPNVSQAEVLWQDMQRENWALGSPGVSGTEVQAVCNEGATFNIPSVNEYLDTASRPKEILFRCNAGIWKAKVPGKKLFVDFDVAECEYRCDPPCQNRGLCILGRFLENTCRCQPDFTGPQCQFKKCPDISFHNEKVSQPADNQAAYTGKIWKVCPEEYIHTSTGNNSYVEVCVDGEWVKPEGKCEPLCDPTCLNNGICVEPNVCSCPKETYGSYCQFRSCANAWTPSINRVSFKSDVQQLNLTCEQGYRFRSGATMLTYRCLSNGTWGFPGETQQCVPDCSEFPCFNNGICVQPNTCKCTEGFTGPQCRRERCHEPPKFVLNANSNYSDRFHLKYDIECFRGYELMNHQSSMHVKCENGIWKFPPGFQDSFMIACRPTCDPPCFNGGQCIAHNICRCTEGFFGPACTKRYEKTLDNKQCLFPFKYHKKWYFSCTTAGFHLPWCATSIDGNSQVRNRSVCVADVGKVRVRQTVSKQVCVFPFRYKGILFYDCATTVNNKAFCATSVNADLSANTTSNCTDIESRYVILTRGGYECTSDYLLGGLYYPKMVEDGENYGLCIVNRERNDNREDELANVVLIDSGYRKNKITITGKLCQFPFTYGGQNFYSCTDQGHKDPWCPTKLDSNRNVLESEPCLSSFISGQESRDRALTNSLSTASGHTYFGAVRIIVTLSGERCLFPFIYNGTSHYKCIHLGDNMPWCATELGKDGKVIARGFCPRDWDPFEYKKSFLSIYSRNNNVSMSVSGFQCVPFKHNGSNVTGCIQEKGQKPWCALAVNSNMEVSITDFCVDTHETTLPRVQTNPEFKDYINMLYSVNRPGILDPNANKNDLLLYTTKGGSCVPFMKDTSIHYGCVETDELIPWCAVDVDKQRFISKQDYCPENWQFWRYVLTLELDFWSPFLENLDTTKTTSGGQCVFPFIHKGKLYHQCVEDERALSWCATKIDCNGRVVEWDYCLPTEGFVVRSSRGMMCVPFLENGIMKEGCTYSLTGDQPWCAVRVNVLGQLAEADICPTNWEATKIVIPKSRRSERSRDVKVMKSEEVVYLLSEDGDPCIPFIYNNTVVKHCVSNQADNSSWCAIARDSEGGAISTRMCPKDWRDTVWPQKFQLQKERPCIPENLPRVPGKCVPFWHLGQAIEGCYQPATGVPWCATAVDKFMRPTQTAVCGSTGPVSSSVVKDYEYEDELPFEESQDHLKIRPGIPSLLNNTDPQEIFTQNNTSRNIPNLSTPAVVFNSTNAINVTTPAIINIVSVPRKNFSGSVMTTSGKECVFPFTFEGQQYYNCIADGIKRPWCATAVSPSGVALNAEICIDTPLLLGSGKHQNITINGILCELPFMYNGKKYCKCTTEDDIKPWCATKVDANYNVISKDYCKEA